MHYAVIITATATVWTLTHIDATLLCEFARVFLTTLALTAFATVLGAAATIILGSVILLAINFAVTLASRIAKVRIPHN
jgi:hypothetical protein